ncbi:MAG TPA: hypothetical protein VIL88_17800 [Devosia sp.]|jgi:hypothetical protein|uniref:hypothetical protein n=1 Tax=Devosia sp. TaxID=1871048 RepID=UPI002F94A7D1
MKTTEKPFLYADIETIPSADPSVFGEIVERFPAPVLNLDSIKADGRFKDLEKIEADVAAKRAKAIEDHAAAGDNVYDNIQEAYRKTALDGAQGHLASIAWAFDEHTVVALHNTALEGFTAQKSYAIHDAVLAGERELLTEFFAEIEDHLFNLAHAAYEQAVAEDKYEPPASNIVDIEPFAVPPVLVAHFADFDIRFIWQRAIALGVTVPEWWPVNASKYATDKVQDTMQMWAGPSGRIGLDRLCRALGVAGKGDMDGSGVWDAVKAGRIAEVVEYNCGDVRRLRSVHRRMRGLAVLAGDVSVQPPAPAPPLTQEQIDKGWDTVREHVESLNGDPVTYIDPDSFEFDEATSTIRLVPGNAELTVTEKTEDGWTAEGVIVVDAPAGEGAR